MLMIVGEGSPLHNLVLHDYGHNDQINRLVYRKKSVTNDIIFMSGQKPLKFLLASLESKVSV